MRLWPTSGWSWIVCSKNDGDSRLSWLALGGIELWSPRRKSDTHVLGARDLEIKLLKGLIATQVSCFSHNISMVFLIPPGQWFADVRPNARVKVKTIWPSQSPGLALHGTSYIPCIFLYQWRYSPMLDVGHFSVPLSFTQLVGLHGRGISSSQGRYLHIQNSTNNKCTQPSVLQVGFEPTIPVFERMKRVHAKLCLISKELSFT
jgi:hypothetical protein